MKNSQRIVLSMLMAVLLLEFGSLSKLQIIWSMAFALPEDTISNGTHPGGTAV